MMSSLPFYTLFSTTLILGSLISISSNNWIFIWMGLEINLMSFIPMLFMSHSSQETEAAMKYFLIQASASGLLLMGAVSLNFNFMLFSGPKFSSFILFTSLIMKLGMAPCHFWLPSMMAAISWPMCLLLTTWQKLAPLIIVILLLNSKNFPEILLLSSITSSLIGGIGGMNQSQLQPMLAYSSIGHMGWIMATNIYSISIPILYFSIYFMIITSLFSILMLLQLKLMTQSLNFSKMETTTSLSLLMIILSLGGLPPLTGFIPKWISIQLLLSNSNMSLALLLIIGSLMNLFYYLNLFFMLKINSMANMKLNKNPLTPNPVLLLTLASISLLPMWALL